MRAMRDAGFEVGIHTWDHVRWQDGVATADAAWTRAEMQRACDRYTDIFGTAPRVHGAAGWQMNAARAATDAAAGLRLLLATVAARIRTCRSGTASWSRCPQLPTTLPTLDELIGARRHHRRATSPRTCSSGPRNAAPSHVYTLHAELEGMRLAPVFEQLLLGWKAQGMAAGVRCGRCCETRAAARPAALRSRSGACSKDAPAPLLMQGAEFLRDVDLAQAA